MKFDKTINIFCKLHESQQYKCTVLKLRELYQPVITGKDYERPIKPFFIEIQNFWAWADKLGRSSPNFLLLKTWSVCDPVKKGPKYGLQKAGCKKTGKLLFKKRRGQANFSLFE